MSTWSEVGSWLQDHAAGGAALVGSLVTGNIPGAIAAGASMIASASGYTDPGKALTAFKSDPATVAKLQEIAATENASIRKHIEAMTALQLQDAQASHAETQKTIRAGDTSESRFVRFTRPGQAWVMLGASLVYIFTSTAPNLDILSVMVALPFAYAGLRGVDKGIAAFTSGKKV